MGFFFLTLVVKCLIISAIQIETRNATSAIISVEFVEVQQQQKLLPLAINNLSYNKESEEKSSEQCRSDSDSQSATPADSVIVKRIDWDELLRSSRSVIKHTAKRAIVWLRVHIPYMTRQIIHLCDQLIEVLINLRMTLQSYMHPLYTTSSTTTSCNTQINSSGYKSECSTRSFPSAFSKNKGVFGTVTRSKLPHHNIASTQGASNLYRRTSNDNLRFNNSETSIFDRFTEDVFKTRGTVRANNAQTFSKGSMDSDSILTTKEENDINGELENEEYIKSNTALGSNLPILNQVWFIVSAWLCGAYVELLSIIFPPTPEVASLGPHLLLALIVMTLLTVLVVFSKRKDAAIEQSLSTNNVEAADARRSWQGTHRGLVKFVILGMAIIFLWFYLLAMENVLRGRLINRSEILASHNLAKSHNLSPTKFSRVDSNVNEKQSDKFTVHDLQWFNTILDSMWIIDGPEGGLGPYISQSVEDFLQRELSQVPPGVAQLSLKKFSFGVNAPVLHSVVVRHRIKNCSICHHHHDESFVQKQRPNYGVKTFYDRNREKAIDKLTELSEYLKSLLCDKIAAKIRDIPVFDAGNLNRWIHSNCNNMSKSSSKPELFPRGCELLISDIKYSYVSKDLDMVLAVRSLEVQSVYVSSELTVALKEIAFAGTFRLVTELIPEYPFVGNTTVLSLLDIMCMVISHFFCSNCSFLFLECLH